MNNESRRKFLVGSMKALGVLGIQNVLANSIVQAIGQTAFAQGIASLNSKKKYIYLSLDGAPPRWFFDIPLTPNGSTDYYPANNSIGTYITKDGNDVLLKNQPWKDPASGYFLPPVWGSNPNSANGAFTNLSNRLYFWRGVDMEIDNHGVTRLRNQAPTIGGLSIAGRLAEKSGNPLPAVVSGSIGDSFRAEKIVTPVTVSHGGVAANNNSIVTALNYVSGKAPINDALLKQSIDQFEKYADENGIMGYGVLEAKDKADAMIVEGVKKFTDQWSTTYNKYVNLVKQAVTSSVNRGKIILDQNVPNPYLKNNADPRMTRSFSAGTNIPSTVANIQDLVKEDSTVAELAAQFAAMEILLVNELTSICTFSLSGRVMDRVRSNTGTGTFNMVSDQHNTGTLASTYVTSLFYRSLIVCLDELAGILSRNGMFQDTIIQIGSEFGRNPREDQSGADHQTMAGSALLISGSFNETRVIGNLTSTKRNGYNGFTGAGAPLASYGGQHPRVNDVVKTVCSFLSVTPVTENGASFLNLTKKQAEAKNVA